MKKILIILMFLFPLITSAQAGQFVPFFRWANATGTNATTTSLFSTRGNFTTLCIVLDCKTVWPFSFDATGYGVSTSTTLGLTGGFISTASSTMTATATAKALNFNANRENVSASQSVGGVVNINRSTFTGPGLVAYTNCSSGCGRLVSLFADDPGYDSQVLHVGSDSLTTTALNVLGAPAGQGLIKAGSSGAGDADGSIFSWDASTNGYIGQGQFGKCSATSAICVQWRDSANNANFVFDGTGLTLARSTTTSATTTNLYAAVANLDNVLVSSTSATSTSLGAWAFGSSITNRDVLLNLDCDGRTWSASNSIGGCLHVNGGTLASGGSLATFYTNSGTSNGNAVNVRVDNSTYAHSALRLDYDGSGDALTIVGNSGGSNAASLSHDGLDHTLNVAYTGSTADKGALNITSTNAAGSAFQVTGPADSLGLAKITHNGVGVVDSSVLSLSASNAGYLGQGIFLDINTVNTLQKLLNLRADGAEILTVTPVGLGIGTSSPATQLHVSAGASATTTVDFGAQSTSAKTCFNVRNNTGAATSFYFVGTTMVVEAKRCL